MNSEIENDIIQSANVIKNSITLSENINKQLT